MSNAMLYTLCTTHFYPGYADDSVERLWILLKPALVIANSTSVLSAGPVHGAKTSFMVRFIVSFVSSSSGAVSGGAASAGAGGAGGARSLITSLFNAIRHAICVVQTNPNAGVLRAGPIPILGESPHPVKNRCWCSRLSSLRVPMRYDPSSSACCERAGDIAGEELMPDAGGGRLPPPRLPFSRDSRRSET